MNDLNNNQFGILSKLNFESASVGQFPTKYLDDNNLFTWERSTATPLTNLEITESNGVKVLNIKTSPARISLTNSELQGVVGTTVKTMNIQVEVDIMIPNLKTRNAYFNISHTTGNTQYSFELSDQYVGGFKIRSATQVISFNYKFVSGKKYNIVVTKIGNKFGVMIDGIVIGKVISDTFNNINTSLVMTTLGASNWQPNAAANEYDMIGELSNFQMSGPVYMKYQNSFTKYGDNLLSRYNFDNISSPGSTNVFIPEVEAVYNPTFNWTLSNTTLSASDGWLKGNKTSFSSNITDKFRIEYSMKNKNRHSDIEMVNIGNKYKLIYSYTAEGTPEPQVIVNLNTKSALDFDSGLVDKIPATTWSMSGSAELSTTDKIYGSQSFKTNDLGARLYSNSQILTGGTTPFTVEFYALISGKRGYGGGTAPDNDYPLFSKARNLGNGVQDIARNKNGFVYYIRQSNVPGGIHTQTGNTKVNLNEINKFAFTYDGTATRIFINDKLDSVSGTNHGFGATADQPYAFLDSYVPDYSQYRMTSLGLVDNVNMFDGVANIVKNVDPDDEFLKIYIPFEGANFSTKYVNLGTSKDSIKLVKANGANDEITNTENLGYGYSSIRLPSNQWLDLVTVNNNEKVSLDLNHDFTISVETQATFGGSGGAFFGAMHPQSNTGLWVQANINHELMIMAGDEATAWAGWKINYKFPQKIQDGYNRIDLVRKNDILYFYLNKKLLNTFNVNFSIDTNEFSLFGLRNSVGLNGFGKNFRFYEKAVFPKNESSVKLEFDNNMNDTYRNSTWSKTPNVTYDIVNSVKGYSAKFDGTVSSYVYSGKVDNLNFGNMNFEIELDTINTNRNNGTYYPAVIASGNTTWGGTNPGVNVSFHHNNRMTFGVWAENNTEFGTGAEAFMNTWYNYKINRVNNTFIQRMNDVVMSSITSYPNEPINLNINNETWLGNAPWNNATIQNAYIGNIDNLEFKKDDIMKDFTVIESKLSNAKFIPSVKGGTLNLEYSATSNPVDTAICVIDECPPVKDFIAEFDILMTKPSNASVGDKEPFILYFKSNGVNGYTDSQNNTDNQSAYLWAVYNDQILLGFGNGTSYTSLLSNPLNASYRDNRFHKVKFEKNDGSLKIYIDDTLVGSGVNSNYANITAKLAICASSWNSSEGLRKARIRSIKVTDLNNKVLYDKTFGDKTIKLDKPAVRLALESNAIDTGYANTIYYNNSNEYAVIDGFKCIRITQNKNIISQFKTPVFDAGINSDFVFSIDMYMLTRGTYNMIATNSNGWGAGAKSFYVNNAGKLHFQTYEGYSAQHSLELVPGQWYSLKLKRKGLYLTLTVNNIEETFYYNDSIDFNRTNLFLGCSGWAQASDYMNGYLKNFEFFTGSSELSETYDSRAVIDVDFSPTRKSYLFKDNFNKVVLHPVNITQRDYKNSKYCCSFNGLDQYIKLGKNSLFDFGKDDFVLRVAYDWSGSSNLYGALICNNNTNISSPMDFVMVLANGNVTIRASNTDIILDADNIKSINGFNTLSLQRSGNTLNIELNGNLYQKTINVDFNLNRSEGTIIGRNQWDNGTNGYFKGAIYQIKAYRNTTDLSLLDPPITAFSEKFKLTNGTDIVEAEYTEIREHDIKVISDTDKVTVKVNDQVLEVQKDSEIANVVLHNGYTGDLKDLRVYDKAFYDNDVYEGTQVINSQVPELEIVHDDDEATQELQVFDIGEYRLTGFIEGYTDRPFIIWSNNSDQVLYEGIADYDVHYLSEVFLDDYEIHDQVSGQKYPVNKTEMKKGHIAGLVNLVKCGVKAQDMQVYCYRSDTFRLIGIYDVDETGAYDIPNLDTNSRYDIIFRDQTKTIKDQISNYRKPASY